MLAPVVPKLPVTDCVVPLKNTARVFGVNVPPFDRFPATYRSPPDEPESVNRPVVLATSPVTFKAPVAVFILIEPPELVRLPVIVVAPVEVENDH